jgi:ABC-type antimicrobial peptide transport system permease subunit
MSDIVRLTARKALKKPGKALLQAAVIAAGALAFSAGLSIAGSIAELERDTYRYRVSIAAGSTDEAGRFSYERRSPFTVDLIDSLSQESGYIRRAAAVNQVNWPAVKVGDSRYSIRSVLSAGENYADIMGVTLLEGRFYTREDADAGSKLVVLSSSVAEALFGSAAEAIGQYLETERGVMAIARGQGGQGGQGAGQNQALRMATERYEVIGVYKNPSELARSALGIPDALIPFGADRPPGMSAVMPVRSIVAETDGTAPAALEERLASTLASLGIDETPLSAWEGDPSTPNASAAAEARKTLASLASAITGLGALILLASVFGIYTSTAMEAADGRKGSAIRRALGEDSAGTALRFASSSAVFGAFAAIAGALLSIPAYRALAKAAEGILGGAGMSEGGIFSALPPLWAPLAAIAATAAACALFALPAAIGASKASIVEGIQEL